MGTPFLGEIRMFGGNFAPQDWELCNGQLLPIATNTALYNLIGTTYGGDGVTTLALPNLQSRVVVHQGQGIGLTNYVMGETGGVEQVTLTAQQVPSHTHPVNASTGGTLETTPTNNAPNAAALIYSRTLATTPMYVGTIPASGGGSQPHDNIMPYLTINFIICVNGIFPTQ